ncbi:BadF/BadG/BcrA/BcrD ATPase family protein [Herbiconiux sp. L3-i23]|uniref:BadF/BadG/BcrA/BcrD ATPase family protein n=1 Tax=Herbiconiux sp. L3-i23 TaxID=2905871 RepID=UPI002048620E|nr:BadF/BadG/BcrA/BcrD ATPase family protein [Herbiconiux sp. L3-i23]BDI22180.1 kinase [Herbiconiux sp. L3-i23]
MTGRLLGVDVGNSKTHIAVAEPSGRVTAAAEGPGVMGGFGSPDALLGLVRDRLAALGLPTSGYAAATFAVAGLDLPEQDAAYEEVVRSSAIADRLVVLNDVFALMRTDPSGGDGVAVVCGAGINAVGVRGGTHVRFHSIGEVSGDWGGGGDVGRAALFAACRSEDGRGEPTALAEGIARHFGVDRALAVTEGIMLGRIAAHRVVELAPLVLHSAAAGDAVAGRIVDRLADEVVLFVEAARGRLGWPDEEILPVLLGGGLLQSGDERLLGRIRSTLGDGVSSHVSVADVPPVIGSVLLARDLIADSERTAHSDVAGWEGPDSMAHSFRTQLDLGGRTK